MYSLLSACTCLCLHFLLLCFQVQMFAAEENVDFRIHVENQTRARDDVSRKQLRLYQLYSRTSGKHIQVLGRRISAKGEDGDKYAQLLVETDTFGSQVRIKGKETDFYLCMNRKGKLVGKVTVTPWCHSLHGHPSSASCPARLSPNTQQGAAASETGLRQMADELQQSLGTFRKNGASLSQECCSGRGEWPNLTQI
ncbi:fibroblast growth factor 18 isoform X2 [Camarhynchus parvulus]|uniref:Fibroblast growth factor 18 n=1 Tax=Geospiza parvula TaxID=87175 RepID=A0A8C3M6N0_GEOPR|nr:fibroblast growth factor 18 isoform X2 [Camarhynchus parvulus]